MCEHLIESVELVLEGGPDLHPKEGAGVVHDVHGSAVQQVPEIEYATYFHCHETLGENRDPRQRGAATFPGSFNAFV